MRTGKVGCFALSFRSLRVVERGKRPLPHHRGALVDPASSVRLCLCFCRTSAFISGTVSVPVSVSASGRLCTVPWPAAALPPASGLARPLLRCRVCLACAAARSSRLHSTIALPPSSVSRQHRGAGPLAECDLHCGRTTPWQAPVLPGYICLLLDPPRWPSR